MVALLRDPGPGAEGAEAAARRAGRAVDRRSARARWPSTSCAGSRGSAQKSEEKLAQSLARLEAQGVDRAHADLGRAAAGRADRRAHAARSRASRTRRTAARCAASPRRSATSTSWWPRATPAPVMEALVAHERGRPRARARRGEDQRRHPARHADRPARGRAGTSSARRCSTSPARRGTTSSCGMRALARGLTLNEYALSRDRGRQASSPARPRSRSTQALGLPFIPPVLREDAGEIEAAEKRRAAARRSARVIGDFHVHTDASRATAARRSRRWSPPRKARGYRVLAITDHAEGTLSGVGREALLEQRARIRALQAELGDSLALLHGVELNIGPERRARLRPRVPPAVRLVPGLGARPLRARSRRADQTHRHGHAGSDGAHDRPPLGAHDRRPAAASTSTSTRSSPPPRRPAPRWR